MPKSPKTILIVDDHEQNRYISSHILRAAGYSVEEASSGRDALQKVLHEPALVILDVRLPDILGYEVCHRIKDNPETASIPVLLVSAAFTSSESRVQALDVGADAYLLQPLEPTVLVATVRALLRLRDAENESHLAARQWETTFDALAEGIAVLDWDSRVVRCNRRMTELLGRAHREIEGRKIRALLRDELNLDLSSADSAFYLDDVKRGQQWLSIRLEPVRDGDQIGVGLVIITDITERRLAEEALRAAEKAAAMGRLANSIAHEINNPLEAITNLLYLLKTAKHDRETTELIEMANVELERVSRITKQTLAFPRETSQAIEVELPELLDSVVTLYSPQFNHRDIRIIRRYEDYPSVPGFPGELRQVFSNVLRNAMEATPGPGQITVRVRRSKDWKDLSREGARITILDSGAGMASEIRRKIFEPFFTTKELKGSGMGLWLSKGIVTKHHGNIFVRSSTKPGRTGTCFSVFLPASENATTTAPCPECDAVA